MTTLPAGYGYGKSSAHLASIFNKLMTPTTYTDEQLKRTLAKMLPDALLWDNGSSPHNTDREPDDAWGLCWDSGNPVLDTELLHLCWLVEHELKIPQRAEYARSLHPPDKGTPILDDYCVAHATWQQRTIALAKTKGIEIV